MPDRIKIAYIIDHLYIGGTERQLIDTIRFLDKSKFDPILVCLKPSKYFAEGNFSCSKITLNVCSLLGKEGMRSIYKLSGIFRRNKVDIVQTYFFDANVVGVIAAQLARVPVIIASRRDMGYWYNAKLRLVSRVLSKFTTRVLANSRAVREAVANSERILRSKIDVIHNGVETDEGIDRGEVLKQRRKLGIPEAEMIIGTTSNLNRRVKRVDIFIKAARFVAEGKENVSFVIIGDGHLRSELEALSRSLGLERKIVFAGQKDNVRPYLAMFDIGVLTSDSEGFSNAILEYLALGIPVVATDVGGNRELIAGRDVGFLVPPSDPLALSESILDLLNDEKKRKYFSSKARSIVDKEFSWDAKIKEMENYYVRLLSIKRRQRTRAHEDY